MPKSAKTAASKASSMSPDSMPLPSTSDGAEKAKPCGPKMFSFGIRIFFSGPWIFAQHPYEDRLIAVSYNPAETMGECMNHSFPFGVWDGEEGVAWDDLQNDLGATPSIPGSLNCHVVKLMQKAVHPEEDDIPWMAPFGDVHTLFTGASGNNFIYFRGAYRLNLDAKLQRVVSIPFPTRIIPAAFRTSTSILGEDTSISHSRKQTSTLSQNQGVATTHIFVYDRANQLLLKQSGGPTQSMIKPGGEGPKADFVFRVVPTSEGMSTMIIGRQHARRMFGHCVGNLKRDGEVIRGLALDAPDPNRECIARGDDVPIYVSDAQLDFGNLGQFNNLASCGSPGFGVGNYTVD